MLSLQPTLNIQVFKQEGTTPGQGRVSAGPAGLVPLEAAGEVAEGVDTTPEEAGAEVASTGEDSVGAVG